MIKVIIVDDEEELASLLPERLNLRGFDVFWSINSNDAIKIVESTTIDVAIIDIRLKDINGLELMKLLRILQPRLKFILFTGHGTEQEAIRGIELGASKYLVKPISIDNLINEINNTINT